MKKTLLTLLPLLFSLEIFSQSVKTKAHTILKELNLPSEVYVVPLPDNMKGLIVGIKAIDTTADLTDYYRDMSEPIAVKLRFKAIADSAKFFSFLSINYTSPVKKAITFNYKMNDKIFAQKH